MWLSAALSSIAEQRLEQTGHDHRFVHRIFEETDHGITMPYALSSIGGPVDNGFASAAAFAPSLGFLES